MSVGYEYKFEKGDIVLVNENVRKYVNSGWSRECLDYIGQEVEVMDVEVRLNDGGEVCHFEGHYLPVSCFDHSSDSVIKTVYQIGEKIFETKEEAREELYREILRKHILESEDPLFYQKEVTREDIIDYLLDNGEELLTSLKKIFRK